MSKNRHRGTQVGDPELVTPSLTHHTLPSTIMVVHCERTTEYLLKHEYYPYMSIYNDLSDPYSQALGWIIGYRC